MVAAANPRESEKPLREPSARNQDVYQRVIIEGLTQREAAAEFGISQGRVCQILKRVGLWIQQTPGDDESASPSERLRLAQYVCKQRLDHAWREAMREWRRSLEPHETTRVIEKPNSRIHEKVIRPGRGHVAALALAGKFVERICCFRDLIQRRILPPIWEIRPRSEAPKSSKSGCRRSWTRSKSTKSPKRRRPKERLRERPRRRAIRRPHLLPRRRTIQLRTVSRERMVLLKRQ